MGIFLGPSVVFSGADIVNQRERSGYISALDHCYDSISSYFPSEFIEDNKKEIKEFLRQKLLFIEKKLNGNGRRWDQFREHCKNFLSQHFEIIMVDVAVQPSKPAVTPEQPGTSKRGRPRSADFESFSKRHKRNILKCYRSVGSQELLAASKKALSTEGEKSGATVIASLEQSPTKGKRLSKIINSCPRNAFLPEKALSIMYKLNLGVAAYKLLKKECMELGHDIFPSYYNVRKVREEFLPDESNFKVTEKSAECNVQALLDETAKSIDRIDSVVLPEDREYLLLSKWGGDGSSGHSMYKQRLINSSGGDTSIYMSTLVPLELRDQDGNVYWKNDTPSSKDTCRPIKITFEKESESLVRKETKAIKKQIKLLQPTIIRGITIKHKLAMTMVDQKVINHLMKNKASCNCYICGATPKQMNKIIKKGQKFEDDPKAYKYGMSPLHAKINTFECLIHIAYRLDLKRWRAKPSEISERKKDIQKKFSELMSLNVDLPIDKYGNTNDGNTARKFFQNPELSSTITGIDADLIRNFGYILSAMSSGISINTKEFENLCNETAQLYVNLYNWYYMPVTVHKILMHGPTVIKYFLLPIGLYAEDAQETRTKDLRRYRLDHTRKTNRIDSNTDLIKRLFSSSDPYIKFLGGGKSKKTIITDPKLLLLLNIDDLTFEEIDEDYGGKDSEFVISH